MFARQLFIQKRIGEDLILIAIHKGLAVRFFKGEWVDHGDGFTLIGDKGLYAKGLLGMQLKHVSLKGHTVPSTTLYDDFIASSIITKRYDAFDTWKQCIDRPYQ